MGGARTDDDFSARVDMNLRLNSNFGIGTDSGPVEIPARTPDEPRWLLVGKIDQKHSSAVITRRGANVRLLSVRRSRNEEVTIYENPYDDRPQQCVFWGHPNEYPTYHLPL